MTTDSSEIGPLVERLRHGCVYHPKRWSGDTHADLGGTVNEPATDAVMREAADEIEALRSLGDELARLVSTPCRCVEAHDGAINETCAGCAAYFDWQEYRDGVVGSRRC